jgi:hypothetical protein
MMRVYHAPTTNGSNDETGSASWALREKLEKLIG